MKDKLYIDIETYSSVDLKSTGPYPYFESIDFEILMIAYAINDNPVEIIDLAKGDKIHKTFLDYFKNPEVENHAHNALFERKAFDYYGLKSDITKWHCSAIKAAYCGFPLSLEGVSEALELGDKGKMKTGKDLIRYFSIPVKPTKTNGKRTRNFYYHDPKKWEDFKTYCKNDVEAERQIDKILSEYDIPKTERRLYILDQKINDRGVKIDVDFVKKSIYLNELLSIDSIRDMKNITGLDNPKSPKQLMEWINTTFNLDLSSIAKDTLMDLKDENIDERLNSIIDLRLESSKSSVKKYHSMINGLSYDGRVKGLFQFYGANRTGRWAGRRVQLQNLPRNKINNLGEVRENIKSKDYDYLVRKFGNFSDELSQLIRTSIIPENENSLAVSDFSAIEARVLAWVAKEKWRLKVFNSHGKIYEASASTIFDVPLEEIDDELRTKGKIAELALGYQGAVGALKAMGAENMGLSEFEMKTIVQSWRNNNPNIVKLWNRVGRCAVKSVASREKVAINEYVSVETDERCMRINLPSGRSLFYQNPKLFENRFGLRSIKFKGIDQNTGKWWWIETYGGKLVENIVQAIARDVLSETIIKLDEEGFDINLHVHDEIASEVPKAREMEELKKIEDIMSENISWAPGLPLNAVGFVSDYYKKD